MKAAFSRFAAAAGKAQGHWLAFIGACVFIVVWAAWGPFAGFSNTWQLVANTATTLVTFVGVFLIQNMQNTSDAAMHLKLDELLRAVERANDAIIDAEDEPEDEITRQKQAVIRAAKEHQP